jgi:hypothetical protein
MQIILETEKAEGWVIAMWTATWVRCFVNMIFLMLETNTMR